MVGSGGARVLVALAALLCAGAALGQGLTAAEVIAAQRAGAPEEGILRLVREAASVAPLGDADVAALRAASVPERVIRAMVERAAPVRPAPEPTAAPAAPPTLAAAPPEAFGPLVRMSGVFRKAASGTLAVSAGPLVWTDAASKGSVPVRVADLRAVWLRRGRSGSTAVSTVVCIRTAAGEESAFRDADWACGGERQVLALVRLLAERFPELVLRDRP